MNDEQQNPERSARQKRKAGTRTKGNMGATGTGTRTGNAAG